VTVKELSQLYYLNREVKLYQDRLEQLEQEIDEDERTLALLESSATSLLSPSFDCMPKGNSLSNKLESNVIQITTLKDKINQKKELRSSCATSIHAKQILCLTERNILEKYIADLPTSLLRLIFTYRFVDGLTWAEVSDKIGMKTTEDSVKKMCYRYIAESNDKNVCPECP